MVVFSVLIHVQYQETTSALSVLALKGQYIPGQGIALV
jgi:hypothetical protein